MLENASRMKKQLLTQCILSVSDRTQMERGLCLPTAVLRYRKKETFADENLHEFNNISAFCKKFYPRIFVRGLVEHVGGNRWKFYSRHPSLKPIRESFRLQKFPSTQSERSPRVTTPTCHAHEPLGLQFVAKTLVHVYVHHTKYIRLLVLYGFMDWYTEIEQETDNKDTNTHKNSQTSHPKVPPKHSYLPNSYFSTSKAFAFFLAQCATPDSALFPWSRHSTLHEWSVNPKILGLS